jgi:hypothetical protein
MLPRPQVAGLIKAQVIRAQGIDFPFPGAISCCGDRISKKGKSDKGKVKKTSGSLPKACRDCGNVQKTT